MDESHDYVCEEHEVKRLPSGYARCPICEEERRIAAEREHLMTRDTSVEPW